MNSAHLNDIIRIAENSFIKEIESFFLSVYPARHLVSHGLEHHRRVWAYSKEIILGTGFLPFEITPLFLNNILIASYFHDIGMANDTASRHGILSMMHCHEFLKMKGLNAVEYKDALEAIEFHDDKEYTTGPGANMILTLLSVADDLDAFGYTGIFRYSDIYLRRGVKPEELGLLIRKNSSARFRNFNQVHGFPELFIRRHTKRFNILDSFFKKYNEQLPGYVYNNQSPSGYCGLIEIMFCELKNESDADFSNILMKYSNDPIIKWFLNGLTSELNQAID